MNRRRFLSRLSMAASGVVVTNAWASSRTVSVFRRHAEIDAVAVLSDAPAAALAGCQRWLNESPSGARFRVREVPVAGRRLGDVTMVRGGALINPHADRDPDARALHALADQLDLPRPINDGTLLTIERCGDRSSTPIEAWVMRRCILVARAPLDAPDRIIRIQGERGVVACRVGNGSAAVVDAPCRHRTCVGIGSVSVRGEWTACLPEQVSITIHGGDRREVDVVTG